MQFAAFNGRENVLSVLLDGGANPDGGGSTRVPIYWAAKGGSASCVRILIDHGAQINKPEKYGENALMVASKKGYTDVVDVLVRNNADVRAKDVDGNTALDIAKLYSKHAVVQYFLSNTNITD